MGRAAHRLLLVLALFVAAESRLATAQVSDELFDRYEVVTDRALRQTVLTGFLLGGDVSDLVVVNIDESDNRRLRIYSFGDGAWAPSHDFHLGPEVSFVDVANVSGRDRLIAYERDASAPGNRGRLNWVDPESGTEIELAAVSSSFEPPRRDEVPHVDMTRDLNGDGLDDLLVPDEDGFWVLVQTEADAFADPVKVGPRTDLSGILGADGFRYDPWSVSRIHEADINLDGRDDLAFWAGDHFVVHLQDERGRYAPVAETITTEVDFDSDDRFSLATGVMTGKTLHALADMNGDGTTDLVIFSLEGRRVSDKRSVYAVHFGQAAADGGIEFATEAGAVFRSPGSIQVGMDRFDFDRDGKTALMITTIEKRFLRRSLRKGIKGAMGDDIRLSLDFYRTKDALDPGPPAASRRIALDGAPSPREPGWVPLDIVLRGPTHRSRKTQETWPRAFNRTLLIGDVTGDGRADLLMEAEFRNLSVFVGEPGPGLFAEEPRNVKVALHDGEFAWLADLNKDGKQDVVIDQPFTERTPHGARKQPLGTEPHRVTILMAR